MNAVPQEATVLWKEVYWILITFPVILYQTLVIQRVLILIPVNVMRSEYDFNCDGDEYGDNDEHNESDYYDYDDRTIKCL